MKIPQDTCVLVAGRGVGDHYLVASVAEAVARHYGVRIWLAGRLDMAFLVRLFPAVEKYLHWPTHTACDVLWGTQVRGGTMFDAHFPDSEVVRKVGDQDFHFLDAYRCRLGLPPGTRLSRARLPGQDEVAAVVAQLTKVGIEPGRFVLLGIDARTTPTTGVDLNFWQRIALRLRDAGLLPVINAAPGTALPPESVCVAAPLARLRALAMTSAGVCTIRSGLSDLLCDLPIPQSVIYPDVRYFAGSLRAGTSFARYELDETPYEVTVTSGSAEATSSDLARFYASRRIKRG